jgi:serine/threonine protein kinase
MSQVYQHTLPAGARIQNYEISGVLGVGGFGITYRAHDGDLDCEVAIKEYLPADIAVRNADGLSVTVKSANDSVNYDHGLKRFLDEGRTLALFREPNIVRVTRYLEANGTAYLVMDYEEGEPLSQQLKRLVSLDERSCIQIAVPVLRGLRAVHARNILHRDIKPANIYLRSDDTPVLIDFGAAREAFGEHSRHITSMVTHGYAPFEQYSPNGKLGPWTDLYALGATLYHCATGVSPPAATERISALQDGADDVVHKVCSQLANRFSPVFLDMICKMLAPQAGQRPQNAGEVLETFEALLASPAAAVVDAIPATGPATVVLKNADSEHVDWKPEVLHAIEMTLEMYIGPLAHILVRKMSGSASSIEQLSAQLSRFIPSVTKQQEFLSSTRHAITTGSATRPVSAPLMASETSKTASATATAAPTFTTTTGDASSFDPELLARIEQALANQLGPMARVLVKNAARQATSLEDLRQRLASELPDDRQRRDFLAALRTS